MNGSKLLVDTNIVLYFLQGNDDIARLFSDSALTVSFITADIGFSKIKDPRIILYEL